MKILVQTNLWTTQVQQRIVAFVSDSFSDKIKKEVEFPHPYIWEIMSTM